MTAMPVNKYDVSLNDEIGGGGCVSGVAKDAVVSVVSVVFVALADSTTSTVCTPSVLSTVSAGDSTTTFASTSTGPTSLGVHLSIISSAWMSVCVSDLTNDASFVAEVVAVVNAS